MVVNIIKYKNYESQDFFQALLHTFQHEYYLSIFVWFYLFLVIIYRVTEIFNDKAFSTRLITRGFKLFNVLINGFLCILFSRATSENTKNSLYFQERTPTFKNYTPSSNVSEKSVG